MIQVDSYFSEFLESRLVLVLAVHDIVLNCARWAAIVAGQDRVTLQLRKVTSSTSHTHKALWS